jgi:hypothetical protein
MIADNQCAGTVYSIELKIMALAVKRIVPASNLLVCDLAFTVQTINEDAPCLGCFRLVSKVEAEAFIKQNLGFLKRHGESSVNHLNSSHVSPAILPLCSSFSIIV